MKTKTNLLIAIAALLSVGPAGFAQGTSATNSPVATSTQEVFRVSFFATCQAFDTNAGRIVTTNLTERSIIAEAVGGSPSDPTLTNQFALVYNAGEDSLQVVDTNLLPVVDVIHFGGGAAIADSRQLDRFTFLFFPGQTNELGAETNVFGSAVITEGANPLLKGTNSGPRITGRLQFLLTGGNVLGMTNQLVASSTTNNLGATNTAGGTNGLGAVAATNTPGIFTNFLASGHFVMTNADIVFDPSAQICIGIFTTAQAVPSMTPPSAPLGTNTNTVSTTNTTNTTNGVARPPVVITGTNGTNTGVMTTNTTGGTLGFNPVTGTSVTNSGTANIGAGSAGGTPGSAGVPGTTSTGSVGIITTPGVTGTTGIGTGAGATPPGSGVITTGTGTVGTGTITTGTGSVGSGAVTTGTGTVGTGTTGATGAGTGIPITTGF